MHWYLPHKSEEYKVSHRLGYQVYSIPRDVHLKDRMAFAYDDALTAMVASKADCASTKVAETHESVHEDGENEDGGNVQ